MIKTTFSIIFLTLCFLTTSKGQESQQDSNTNNQLTATYVVIPKYLAAALATRSQGEVIVEVTISHSGIVTEAKTVDGNVILGGNSISFLRKWKFNPSKNVGDVRRTTIALSYKLVKKRDASTEISSIFSIPFRVEITEVVPEEKVAFTKK